MISPKDGSWVVISKETGKAVLETFDFKVAKAINLQKYKVVPILAYLQDFNSKVKGKALKNPSGKIAYIAKYSTSGAGAGKIAFAKKSSSLPTIRAIPYPHEIAKSQFERYIGEHVCKIVKDTVKVTETNRGGKRSWKIEIL